MKYNPNNMFGHYPADSFWPRFEVRTRSDIRVAATEAAQAVMLRYCQMANPTDNDNKTLTIR